MRQSEGERRRRFNALFESYSPDIAAYCGWRAGSPSDAQDAVAEVFLTAWRRLDRLPEGDAARVYGVDPADGRWFVLGPPASIDPGSGTTPAEYLAAVREDVGGVTLRRIADGLTGPTTSPNDGSTVYRGTVAAALIARESGFRGDRRSGCSRSGTCPTTRRLTPPLSSIRP